MDRKQQLQQAAQKNLPVYYLQSTDSAELEQNAYVLLRLLGSEEQEMETFDGPAPSLEELTPAAGMISFFSAKRILYLPLLKPSAYGERDLKELCALLESTESAVFVMTTLIAEEWGKPRPNKSDQKLFALCQELGFALSIAKPTLAEYGQLVRQRAQQNGASIAPKAASLLLERCGQDRFLLENEVDKLAAYAGYGEITAEMVRTLGARSLEADVFDLVRLVNQGQTARALQELETLLQLQNEPIAIAAALAGSYLDLYRVVCGAAARKGPEQVFRDFGYKGSPYRLKKVADTARRYSKQQLLQSLRILAELDRLLKSSGAAHGRTYLQKALCQMAACGGTR